MASFFNSIGSGLSNTFNSIGSGINSGVSWFNNTGVGGFFTNTLNSTSNFLSGLSNIPAVFGNLVNGIANNSTLFLIAIVVIGGAIVLNYFKGNSSSSYRSYS